jgi:hypothetical protein
MKNNEKVHFYAGFYISGRKNNVSYLGWFRGFYRLEHGSEYASREAKSPAKKKVKKDKFFVYLGFEC